MVAHVRTVPASAVVLAGGKSSRMGRPKALLPFDGEPLITHTVRLLQRLFTDIVLVAAPGQDLPALPVTLVRDEVAYQGPVAGILYGLRAAREELCFVISCDAPFLYVELIAHLLSLATEYDVVVPHWEGRLQPLHAVYRRSVAPLLQEQLERGELRPIFLYKKVRTREVSEEEIRRFDSEGLSFRNMNSPEDYQAALTLWRARRKTQTETERKDNDSAHGLARSVSVPPLCLIIELFGVARLKAKTNQIALQLLPSATVTDALTALANACPALLGAVIAPDMQALLPGHACNLNGLEFIKDYNTPIHDGDHLLILSSDAGG
ncbi:MAG TPA: NTP transferase domain-containing protein [Methylomirabilota bacterium]|jgi:molybdopterin-guanine dinucleotide biosynthesis protein A/molybdopterin converting factor small subunit|nr:NTP transferase domain-containing protein [Methylomirabilota bacterium]